MEPLKMLSFRDLYKNLIYIEDKNTLEIMIKGYGVKSNGSETGLLCYGYMDADDGMCFNVMSLVGSKKNVFGDDELTFNDGILDKNINHTLRLDDIFNLNAKVLEMDPDDLLRYVDRAKKVNNSHMVSDELELVRLMHQLDDFRHFIYADDMEGYIYDVDSKKLEGIWIRSKRLSEVGVIGDIITDLSEDSLYKIGDEIELQLYEVDGNIRLMNILES